MLFNELIAQTSCTLSSQLGGKVYDNTIPNDL